MPTRHLDTSADTGLRRKIKSPVNRSAITRPLLRSGVNTWHLRIACPPCLPPHPLPIPGTAPEQDTHQFSEFPIELDIHRLRKHRQRIEAIPYIRVYALRA